MEIKIEELLKILNEDKEKFTNGEYEFQFKGNPVESITDYIDYCSYRLMYKEDRVKVSTFEEKVYFIKSVTGLESSQLSKIDEDLLNGLYVASLYKSMYLYNENNKTYLPLPRELDKYMEHFRFKITHFSTYNDVMGYKGDRYKYKMGDDVAVKCTLEEINERVDYYVNELKNSNNSISGTTLKTSSLF